LNHCFSEIVSVDNLLEAWKEFEKGKKNKPDVQEFSLKLMDNILSLNRDLSQGKYRHGGYESFIIHDPKQRHIHKAEVRDRMVHHAIYRILYPIFDESFIHDSYSCRNDKGTHKAVRRLESFYRRVSRNYTHPCFALKCDIKKFFFSVDHEILLGLIEKKIKDTDVLSLIDEIIQSFSKEEGKGIPIGNLTSQLFANIYLHELDMFVKHELKVRYYIRYCDDFVILSDDILYLENVCAEIKKFVEIELKLSFHKDKITIRKLKQGIDFLGYVVLPHHTVLRTKTKKRMLQRVNENNVSSYLGILKHCDGYRLEEKVKDLVV